MVNVNISIRTFSQAYVLHAFIIDFVKLPLIYLGFYHVARQVKCCNVCVFAWYNILYFKAVVHMAWTLLRLTYLLTLDYSVNDCGCRKSVHGKDDYILYSLMLFCHLK